MVRGGNGASELRAREFVAMGIESVRRIAGRGWTARRWSPVASQQRPQDWRPEDGHTDSGDVLWNSWVRGVCKYGVLPSNGLLYAPPHACGCYTMVKTTGFFALAPRNLADTALPAVARELLFVAGSPAADGERSGVPPDAEAGLLLAVSTADGSVQSQVSLTSRPVFDGLAAAEGKLFLAQENGRVVCLE